MDNVQDKFVTLNGLRSHYRDWAPPRDDAPVLILLHGLTSHAHAWDTIARALCARYRILALDQRGHGESDWANEYTLSSAIQDLSAFAEALRLNKFALMGHSMGGLVAYNYTPSHLDQVKKLIIVDMAPEIMPAFSQRLGASMQANDVFDNPEQAFQQMRAGNPRPTDHEMRERAIHNLTQRADNKWTWRYDRGFRDGTRALERLAPEPQWQLLNQITCPTLLVRGAETDLLARETAERMTRTIPDCKLVDVSNAGHSVPLDNPERFVAAVREFL
jgi:pimeloyl-ACP methyl ester carboxylesterase